MNGRQLTTRRNPTRLQVALSGLCLLWAAAAHADWFPGGRLETPLLSGAPRGVALEDFDSDGVPDLLFSESDRVVAWSGDGAGSFGPMAGRSESVISVGNQLGSLVVRDFNSDGYLDFAVTNRSPDTLWVALGDGSGNFPSVTEQPVDTSPEYIDTADLNNDGVLDLVVCPHNFGGAPDRIAILLGDGVGGFVLQPPLVSSFIGGFRGLDLGDVDGDGNVDLMYGGSSSPCLFRGDGTGGFDAGILLPIPGIITTGTGLGDLNGDGILDLVEGDFSCVAVRLGVGGGVFAAPTILDSSSTGWVDVVDVDEDGNHDVLVLHETAQSFSIWRGDGTGALGGREVYPTGCLPTTTLLEDIDSDGALDLVVANTNSRDLSVYLGNGTGDFGVPKYPTTTDPRLQQVGDFNRDGIPDLAVAGGGVAIHLGVGSGLLPPVEYGFPDPVRSIQMSDIDADGNLDMVVTSGDSVFVRMGSSTADFSASASFPVGGISGGLQLADVDANGTLDAVLYSSGPPREILMLSGDGAGGFGVPQLVLSIVGPFSGFDLADLDGDGYLDLGVVADDVVSLYAGNGTGSFALLTTRTPSGVVTSIDLQDYNGDGAIDVAVSAWTPEAILFYLGNGSGGVDVSPISVATEGGNPNRFLTADFDDDGAPDLVVSHGNQCRMLEILPGFGGLAFGPSIMLQSPQTSVVMAVLDLNGDGALDLTAPAYSPPSVWTYINATGSAGFRRGDANADGVVDLSDAVFQLFALLVTGSPQPGCDDSADVNDDGSLDLSDPVFLLGSLFVLGSPSPPSPYPGCGPDPTQDIISCDVYTGCP